MRSELTKSYVDCSKYYSGQYSSLACFYVNFSPAHAQFCGSISVKSEFFSNTDIEKCPHSTIYKGNGGGIRTGHSYHFYTHYLYFER